jgi:transcription elongation factor Elf1
MAKTHKLKRRLTDVDVYYRCPSCEWIGYCVTDRYYIQCAKCNWRFGVTSNSVTKEMYDKRFK